MTHPSLLRAIVSLSGGRPGVLRTSLLCAVVAASAPAQVRPPGGTGVNPGVNVNPGAPGTTIPGVPAVPAGPRVVTDNAVLLGETVQATAVIPNTGGAGGGAVNPAALTATYLWTIADGTKIFLRKSLKAWEDTLPATHFMRLEFGSYSASPAGRVMVATQR